MRSCLSFQAILGPPAEASIFFCFSLRISWHVNAAPPQLSDTQTKTMGCAASGGAPAISWQGRQTKGPGKFYGDGQAIRQGGDMRERGRLVVSTCTQLTMQANTHTVHSHTRDCQRSPLRSSFYHLRSDHHTRSSTFRGSQGGVERGHWVHTHTHCTCLTLYLSPPTSRSLSSLSLTLFLRHAYGMGWSFSHPSRVSP